MKAPKKAPKKVYKLEDFFTATLAETPAKMPLLNGETDTGQYLLVLGGNSASLKRPKIAYRVGYQKLIESAKGIADKLEQEIFIAEGTEKLDIELASLMVTGSSFGESDKETAIKIITENAGLSNAVISFGYDNENYLAKK